MSKKGSKAFLTEWLIGAFLIVVFLAGYLGDWSTFRPLRHMAADTLASLDHPSKDSDALVVVSIDDESLAKIGTWPWPRTLLAQLIEIVRKSGAKVIGVTFPLSDPDHSQGIEELRTIERRLRAQAEALSTVKELRDLRTKLSASTTAPPASKKPEQRSRDVEMRLLYDLYRDLLREVQEAETRLDQDTKLAAVIADTKQLLLLLKVELGEPPREEAPTLSAAILANAIGDGNASLGRAVGSVPASRRLIPPLLAFQRDGLALGHGTLTPDEDGLLRHDSLVVEYRGRLFPSFELRAIAAFHGTSPSEVKAGPDRRVTVGAVVVPTDRHLGMRIRFYGPSGGFPVIPAHLVLSRDVPSEKLRGKLVLIGLTATGLMDPKATPRDLSMPSVEIRATAIQNLLDGYFVAVPPWDARAVLALFIVVAAFLVMGLPRINLAPAVMLSVLILLGFWWVATSLYQRGHDVGVVYPAALLMVGMTVVGLTRVLRTESPRWLILGAQSNEDTDTLEVDPKGTKGTLVSVSASKNTTGPTSGELTPFVERARRSIGRYEILEELGRGAMGVVYLGRDPNIHRSVAIKTLRLDDVDPEQLHAVRDRFFREAESAGQLSHPNIVTIYDAGEEDGLGYIAMEILDGENLKDRCRKDNLLPVPRVLDIVARVAEALDYAHSQGIVHRDVKPSNIMMMPDGTVKVTDFGIARMTTSSKTQTGILLGTPSYMSPQQLAGAKVDGRSDLFSLGVVLFELLTGEKPFDAETVTALMYQIVNHAHPRPRAIRPDLPPECDDIVDRALQKEAMDRYGRGMDMSSDLRQCLGRFLARAVGER